MSWQIRLPVLEISPEDPFRDDALERSLLEKPLSDFICNAEGPLVLAIDGSWGTGKTTFFRMWQQQLINRNCHCLYFNAWGTDFADDPLIALVSELTSCIERIISQKKLGVDVSKKQKVVRQLALSLVKKAIPAAVRVITLNTLELDKEIERVIANLVGEISEDYISTYEKKKTELEEFKKSLQELVVAIADKNNDPPLPVIIFVDELDRCRPSYAVELLERIKHLFNVPGIVFVLGIDRPQLSHSIRALYGADFDAKGYLRRFIDIDYRLPKPKTGEFCEYLFNTFGIHDVHTIKNINANSDKIQHLKKIIALLFDSGSFSLRHQIQVVSRLRIILQMIPKNQDIFPSSLAVLLFLHHWDNVLYEQLISNKINVEKVILKLKELPNLERAKEDRISNNVYPYIEAVLLTGAVQLGQKPPRLDRYKEIEQELQKEYGNELNFSLNHIDPEKREALEILETIEKISNKGYKRFNSGFIVTSRRLALTQNFVIESE